MLINVAIVGDNEIEEVQSCLEMGEGRAGKEKMLFYAYFFRYPTV